MKALHSQDGVVFGVDNVHVAFQDSNGLVHAVQNVSMEVHAGEVLAVVGESGSGKTATCLAALDLLPANGGLLGGSVIWKGETVRPDSIRSLRGREIGVVFQDSISSLDPLMPVGRQVSEVLRVHLGLSGRAAKERVLELFRSVGISDPERRMKQYPFELSGGMAQRVMIAVALAVQPKLLIADEPTTALDVTIQAQILDLLDDIQARTGIAIVIVTHDLGVVARLADRVAVMYGGRIVETGPAKVLLERPSHPYTRALLAATPDPHRAAGTLQAIPGNPPELREVLDACAFADRCDRATDVCRERLPAMSHVEPQVNNEGSSHVACWHAL